MKEHRSLNATALLILIIAFLIAALSGLCSLMFAADNPTQALAFIFFGAIGFIPAGLLVFAMRRHIKKGPNLTSELIAAITGLCSFFSITVFTGSSVMGLGISIALLPGILLFGWAVWSFVARSNRIKTTHALNNEDQNHDEPTS